MLPALRLAISALSGRPRRTALLTLAVALSALLVAAVTTATSSVERSLQKRIEATVGRAQAKLEPASGRGGLGPGVVEMAGRWDEVELVVPRLRVSISAEGRFTTDAGQTVSFWSTALGVGIDAERERRIRPIELVAGRLPAGDREVAVDEALSARLAGIEYSGGVLSNSLGKATGGEDPDGVGRVLTVGDEVRLRKLLGRSEWYEVVGVVRQPPLGGRPRAYFTLGGLAWANQGSRDASQIDLLLREGVEPEAFVKRVRPEVDERFDRGVLIQTSARITSGLQKNLRSSRVGSLIGSLLAFLTAGFIITTGLTVDVAQRQCELAMVRCIGGKRAQLALSQLFVGAMIGGGGALLGVPMGVGATWVLVKLFSEQLGVGLHVAGHGLLLAGGGSLVAGVAGAAWPAWKAASTSPLRAMRSQATPPSGRGVRLAAGIGLACLAIQLATVWLPETGYSLFWAYISLGLPAMFVGYFLLGVPACALTARLLGGVIDRALGLPRGMLRRTVSASPARYGFTAGAMMSGLALMLVIWAQGGSVMRDWLDKMNFPDAFVYGLSLAPETEARLRELPFVRGTTAITVHPIETGAFGVRGLTSYRSSFIAFEPDEFFSMARLQWLQGDPERAKRRLSEGGAIIVAREFMVAQGLGVGDTFTCTNAMGEDRTPHEFEIVGVVTSPGLDIVSTFFRVGENYTEQALHAVFGTRDDLRERFGSDAVQLVQVDVDPGFDDVRAVEIIREELFDAGILDAGSGRAIKEQLRSVIAGTLMVSTAIAIGSMIVASFGVANLIVASVDARRHELGVLRAIGAGRASLARMLVGESVVVAVAACALGFVMHFQATMAGRRLNRLLIGIELEPFIPWSAVGLGFAIVAGVCVMASLPAAIGVLRRRPRELLASG